MEIMFDGWYSEKEYAQGVLEFIGEQDGCYPIGVVESEDERYGLFYWVKSDCVLFENHRITGPTCFYVKKLWDEIKQERARLN